MPLLSMKEVLNTRILQRLHVNLASVAIESALHLRFGKCRIEIDDKIFPVMSSQNIRMHTMDLIACPCPMYVRFIRASCYSVEITVGTRAAQI
jgi:hypothetical protein